MCPDLSLELTEGSCTDQKRQVYFWTTIRKNRSKYNLTRGINQDDITHVLLHNLIVEKDLQKTEASLLELPGLRKYYHNLKSDKEEEHFKKHMRKYINIWNTDCPFEVSTTNRYTIVTHEAAVTARRKIKKGDVIKYLCGNKVAMTPEEESDLDLTRRDFSIVVSSRKKMPSLFLGPARFANHDCNANARLVTRGSDGMEVVAVRDISEGDEITVTYGDHYFGENNCECLCLSCEKAGRGGWPAQVQSATASGISTPLDIEMSGHYSLRSSKRNPSVSSPGSASMTPEFSELPPPKRLKTNAATTPSPSKGSVQKTAPQRKSLRGKSSLRNEMEPISSTYQPGRLVKSRKPLISPPISQSEDVPVKEEDELVTSLKAGLAKARDHNRRKRTFDEISTAGPDDTSETQLRAPHATSHSIGVQTRALINVPETPRTPSNLILTAPKTIAGDSQSSVSVSERTSPSSAPPASTPLTTPSKSVTPSSPKIGIPIIDNTDSDLSDLSPTADFDDSKNDIIRRAKPPPLKISPNRRTHKMLSSVLPTVEVTSAPDVSDIVQSSLPSTRTPTDYIRTPLLLGEKYSRWVDCHTCNNTWVQANGYLTRKECPRCERHSMLYGYQWPKTERAGKGDEERVMDHRTVHRFLTTEEERSVRKRGRGLNPRKEGEVMHDAEVSDAGEEEEVEESPKKRTRRGTAKAKEAASQVKAKGVGKGKGKGKGKVKVADDKVVKKNKGGRPRKVKLK